ncbi:MAG TPA: transketolase C-terminal domain-containing protein [Streptosporangiaceae bacterium]|jgi:pyruvate dehydrogenase E1 component beta subunit
MPADGRLTYAEAANAALRRALAERPECIVFGEDVALPGGVFGVTKGLHRAFGDRVLDTPISETAMLGAAVGAALMGMRPVVEIMWMDFALVALDQIVNQAANARYVSRGSLSAPLTIRTQQGSQPGACAQHSQSLEALLTHVPGIRVCLPATAQDAHDLLLAAIWCDDPVVVIENRNLYFAGRHDVTTGGRVPSVGGAAVRRAGTDVTLLSWGAMVGQALAAADRLAADNVQAEVIDARWLNPFDLPAVLQSVRKTRRLAIAHEANLTGAFSAQVVTSVAEAGERLLCPPVRIGAPDVRIPAAPALLAAVMPDAESIAARVLRMTRNEAA